MTTSSTPNTSTSTAFIAVSLIFGSSFLLTKMLVGELTPLQVVAARTALGASVVMAMLAEQGRLPRLTRQLFGSVLVLALLDGVIPHTLISMAQTSLDSGVTAVLIATMPLFTAVFAWLLLPAERFTYAKALGLVIGLSGVVVLMGGNGSTLMEPSLGHILALLGAMSYAAAAVYARNLLAAHDAMSLTGLKLSVSAVISIALTLGVDGSPHTASLSMTGIVAMLALGIVATGVARVLYFWVIEHAGSVHASLIAYVIPVVGVILGWAVLDERIYAGTLTGMAMIIAGVATVMFGQTFAATASSQLKRVAVPALNLMRH